MVSTPKDMSRWIQPAHTISFVPPVTIVNLLPCHLSFRIVYFSNSTEKITSKSNTDISPGKKSFISVSEYRYLLNDSIIFPQILRKSRCYMSYVLPKMINVTEL